MLSGDDGNRYKLERNSIAPGTGPLRPGLAVDFIERNGVALEVYADPTFENRMTGAASGGKSKIVAGLLALFFGALGIHKFYLGRSGAGVFMLLVSIFGFILLGLPTIIIGIIAFIEGIIYLTASDEHFYAAYVQGRKSWF